MARRFRSLLWLTLLGCVVFLVYGGRGSVSSIPLQTKARFRTPGPLEQKLAPCQDVTLPILTYHRVSNVRYPDGGGRVMPVERFEEHLIFLRRTGHTFMTFEDVSRCRRELAPWPTRPVVLSFDDGYSDNLYEAYPLMKRHGAKGVFFVIAGRVGCGDHMKWYDLARLDRTIVEVGAHTMNHVNLAGVSIAVLKRELLDARRLIERRLERSVISFAYPYGAWDARSAFGSRVAGYEFACTTERGRNDESQSPFSLKRYTVASHHRARHIARMVGCPYEEPSVD